MTALDPCLVDAAGGGCVVTIVHPIVGGLALLAISLILWMGK